jgi:hypothetical protein
MKSKSTRKSGRKSKSLCKSRLAKKIAINMKEMKEDGRYVSKAQAIAVAYSQVQKMYPGCKRILKKKN